MNDQLKLAEKIYKQVLDWYKSAEKKAQIMLTILSSFIVFSTGIIFSNPDSFEKTLAKFDALMFLLLILTVICVLYGIYTSFKCLESRMRISEPSVNGETNTYYEKDMYFFGSHSRQSEEVLYNTLCAMTDEKSVKMYTTHIIILSKNVVQKHKYINLALISVAMAVTFLLIIVAYYFFKI